MMDDRSKCEMEEYASLLRTHYPNRADKVLRMLRDPPIVGTEPAQKIDSEKRALSINQEDAATSMDGSPVSCGAGAQPVGDEMEADDNATEQEDEGASQNQEGGEHPEDAVESYEQAIPTDYCTIT